MREAAPREDGEVLEPGGGEGEGCGTHAHHQDCKELKPPGACS